MNKHRDTRIPNGVLRLTEIFEIHGFELYLVGGCVRDLILNLEPHDWDLCTNATPDQMQNICTQHNLKLVPTGIKHGTVTICIDHENFEVTTYRFDGIYSDGRHPEKVEFTTDITEDLARRDFTINAIAMNPVTTDLIDPYGGCIDICMHNLRAVGYASERLQEDALRILRALRFAIKYDLEIDPELRVAIHDTRDMLLLESRLISRERVTDEFRKIFQTGKPVTKIFTEYRDVLAIIMPEIAKTFDFNQNNRYHKHDVYGHLLAVVDNCKSNKFEIRMAALLHDIGKPDAYTEDADGHGHFYGHPKISADIARTMLRKQFRLSNTETKRILDLIEHHDADVRETTKSVKRMLNAHGVDFMMDWFILKQADMDDHIYPDDKYIKNTKKMHDIMQQILTDAQAFSLKDLAINGSDLITELHLKPSPFIGEILHVLLSEVLDEQLVNNRDSLIKRAKELRDAIH